MKHGAVIFDLDGTLLDTLDDLANSMNSVLEQHGFPSHELELYKYFVGDGMENLVRRALPKTHSGDPATVAKVLNAMREEYHRRWNEKTHPYPGVPELLEGLTKRDIKMAILSNKPDEFTKAAVTAILPQWRFERIFGERPFVPRKPNPVGALRIADELKLLPRQFLYLGDTGTDMKTADAAGMYAVGALWGFRKADELLANGARTLIEQPADLLALL